MLNSLPAREDGWLIEDEGASLAVTADGSWPSTPTLTIADTPYTPTITGSIALWTLTLAQVAALLAGGVEQVRYAVTLGTGDAKRTVCWGFLIRGHRGLQSPAMAVRVVIGPPGDLGSIADGSIAQVKVSGLVADLAGKQPAGSYATATQGAKADTALQPGGLATVATTGAYGDLSGKPTLGDAAGKNTGTAAGTVAAGDDSRFTDSRTPTAHAASHAAAGSDPVTPASIGAQPAGSYATGAQGTKADTAVQPGSLAAVATTGAYSDLSGKPTLGDAAAKNTGTGTGTVAAGDDSRMSDARTPTAHAASHAAAGGDPVTLTQAQVTGLPAALAYRAIRDAPISQAMAIGNTTASLTAIGCSPTSTGTATIVTMAHTSLYAAYRKSEYLVTVAATTAVAGLRGSPFVARGVSGYPNSGWSGVFRGGPATGLTGAGSTHRFFMGLRAGNGAPTNVNPSSLADIFGIGWDSGDTNIQLFYNNASGTATKVNLGVARPTVDRTTSSGVIYELETSCAAAGSSITWTLTELLSGSVIGSGTVSAADIPTATTALTPVIYASVGGTSSVVGVAFCDWYFESLP